MGWSWGDFEAGNHFLVLGSKSRALGRQLGHECPLTQGQTPGSQESRDCRKRDRSHGEAGDFPDQVSQTRVLSLRCSLKLYSLKLAQFFKKYPIGNPPYPVLKFAPRL